LAVRYTLTLEHRGDGSGNIVFWSRKGWLGMEEDVGFLDLADALDVEAIVLRTLGSEAGPGRPTTISAGPRTTAR
jgi:hypothetical protein